MRGSSPFLPITAGQRAAGSPDCLAAPLDLGYAWGPPGVSPLDSGRAGSRISGHDCPSRGAGLSCCRSHTPVTAQPGPGTVSCDEGIGDPGAGLAESPPRGPPLWGGSPGGTATGKAGTSRLAGFGPGARGHTSSARPVPLLSPPAAPD